MKIQKLQFYKFYMKFCISKHHKRRNFSVSWLREGRKRSVKFTAYPDHTFLQTLNSEAFSPFPQPEIEKISSCMVFTDTKLHTEIIKELFWNFHWGHYVSVSHLEPVKYDNRTIIRHGLEAFSWTRKIFARLFKS